MLSADNTPYMSVKVSDPIKQAGNFGSHVTYKISTNSNLEGFSLTTELTVERRYNDFVWLYEQLTEDFPGVVIPPLPEKQTFGFAKFGFTSESYLEARQRGLELFLKRVSTHHLLINSKKFLHFLSMDELAFNNYKLDISNSKKTDPLQWLEYTAKKITLKKTELEKTEADEKFEEIDNYLTLLSESIIKVSKSVTLLIKRDRQVASELFVFSQELGGLGQCEGNSLSAALIQCGSSIDQLSQAATKRGDQELVEVDEPFQEYVRTLHSLKLALARREELKKEYATAMSDVDSKQQAFSKVQGTGKEDEPKKQAALEKAQQFCACSKENYERVSLELQEEFDAFKKRKAVEITGILMKWAEINITYCQRAQETWSQLGNTVQTIVPVDFEEEIENNPFNVPTSNVPIGTHSRSYDNTDSIGV